MPAKHSESHSARSISIFARFWGCESFVVIFGVESTLKGESLPGAKFAVPAPQQKFAATKSMDVETGDFPLDWRHFAPRAGRFGPLPKHNVHAREQIPAKTADTILAGILSTHPRQLAVGDAVVK